MSNFHETVNLVNMAALKNFPSIGQANADETKLFERNEFNMKNIMLRRNNEGTVTETSTAITDLLPYGTIGSFTIDFTALPSPYDKPVSERARNGENVRYDFFLQREHLSTTNGLHTAEEIKEYGAHVFKVVYVDSIVDGQCNNYCEICCFSPKTRGLCEFRPIVRDWWHALTNDEIQLRLDLIAATINDMLPELIHNAEYEEYYPEKKQPVEKIKSKPSKIAEIKYREYLEGNDYHKRFAAMLETYSPDPNYNAPIWEIAEYKALYEYHKAKKNYVEVNIVDCRKRRGIYAALSEQEFDETLKQLCYIRRGHTLHAIFWKRAYESVKKRLAN